MSGCDPRISLVTPSFNQADYLEETLRSVLDQGYSCLEYVVIDGGSSDGSVEIIGRYADRLAAWVSEPDGGHTDGLNKGFARTGGEIMGWVNSSDVQFPWTLRTVAEVFRDIPDAQWIMGLQTHVARGGGPKTVCSGTWNVYDFLAGDYRWLQQESVFWRRELWERVGGRIDPGARYTCDFSLWLRFMELAPLYHVEVPLGGFRHHGERRGTAAGGAYAAEALEQWEQWRAAAPVARRQRGRLVGAAPAPLATPWRAFLERSSLTPWYRHKRVGYDFDADTWVAR